MTRRGKTRKSYLLIDWTFLMGKPANDQVADEVFIVEVIGHDGIVHHLGPFSTRADAEAWMVQNTRQPFGEKTERQSNDAYGPRLSLV